jgi:hypothetical protein
MDTTEAVVEKGAPEDRQASETKSTLVLVLK